MNNVFLKLKQFLIVERNNSFHAKRGCVNLFSIDSKLFLVARINLILNYFPFSFFLLFKQINL